MPGRNFGPWGSATHHAIVPRAKLTGRETLLRKMEEPGTEPKWESDWHLGPSNKLSWSCQRRTHYRGETSPAQIPVVCEGRLIGLRFGLIRRSYASEALRRPIPMTPGGWRLRPDPPARSADHF